MAGGRPFPSVLTGPHRSLRAGGAASAAGLAGIHLDRLPVASREATYLGVLFAVAVVSLGWVVLRLLRSDGIDGWLAAAALAAGTTVGYVLSCTVGLPGLAPERWSALGDSSAGLATVLLALAAIRSAASQADEFDASRH